MATKPFSQPEDDVGVGVTVEPPPEADQNGSDRQALEGESVFERSTVLGAGYETIDVILDEIEIPRITQRLGGGEKTAKSHSLIDRPRFTVRSNFVVD